MYGAAKEKLAGVVFQGANLRRVVIKESFQALGECGVLLSFAKARGLERRLVKIERGKRTLRQVSAQVRSERALRLKIEAERMQKSPCLGSAAIASIAPNISRAAPALALRPVAMRSLGQ